jgi:hypothetical protein
MEKAFWQGVKDAYYVVPAQPPLADLTREVLG